MDDLLRQAKHERLLRFARTDASTFNELVLKDTRTGEFIKEAAIHRSWQEHIEYCFKNGKKAGILAHWGSGKSSIVIGRILHTIGQQPGIRIKVVCNDGDQAAGRVSTVKQYIEHSKEYHAVFPDVKPDYNTWATNKFSIQRPVASPDATVTAHGIMTTGIGGRADMLIFDDPVDFKNAIAEPKKQKTVIDSYYNVWISREEPDIKTIYIATRWTMTDLTSVLLKSTDYIFLIQKVSKDLRFIEEELVCG